MVEYAEMGDYKGGRRRRGRKTRKTGRRRRGGADPVQAKKKAGEMAVEFTFAAKQAYNTGQPLVLSNTPDDLSISALQDMMEKLRSQKTSFLKNFGSFFGRRTPVDLVAKLGELQTKNSVTIDTADVRNASEQFQSLAETYASEYPEVKAKMTNMQADYDQETSQEIGEGTGSASAAIQGMSSFGGTGKKTRRYSRRR